jgi:DNA-binding transcriptional ArsR family regulator
MNGNASYDTFKALGDPTRRAILDLLRETELTVGELACRRSMLDRCDTASRHFTSEHSSQEAVRSSPRSGVPLFT